MYESFRINRYVSLVTNVAVAEGRTRKIMRAAPLYNSMIAGGDAQANGQNFKGIVSEHLSGRAIDGSVASVRTWLYERSSSSHAAAQHARVPQNERAGKRPQPQWQTIHGNLPNARGERARRFAASEARSERRRNAGGDPPR